MPFSNEDRANLVICAADADQIWHTSMKDGVDDPATPKLASPGPISTNNGPPKLHTPDKGSGIGFLNTDNFDYLGHLRADDVYLFNSDPVYYGMVLRAKTNNVPPVAQNDVLIAVKGTEGTQEWINNATALAMIQDSLAPNVLFSAGFIKVYDSMYFVDDKGVKEPDLMRALQPLVAKNNPNIYITGHSLGAALATYLTYDLYTSHVAPVSSPETRVFPFFFASPRTGDRPWTSLFEGKVKHYQLVNYAADAVPDLPPDGTALSPHDDDQYVKILAQDADGHLDTNGDPLLVALGKHHSPTGYAHMIDPDRTHSVYSIASEILKYQIDVGQAHP